MVHRRDIPTPGKVHSSGRYIPPDDAPPADDEMEPPSPLPSRVGKRSAVELTVERIKAARHSGRTYRLASGKEAFAREVLWDKAVPGLGLRLAPSGRHSWILRYRLRRRWKIATLDAYGRLTLKAARDLARLRIGSLLATGVDPFARAEGGLAWDKFVEQVRDDGRARLKPRSLLALETALVAATEDFGSTPVDEIEHRDVLRAFARWTKEKGPIAANTYLAFVSGAFKLARRLGLVDPKGSSPTQGVERNPTRKRDLDLTPADLERLGEAFVREEAERPEARDTVQAIRLLALSGCRREEITGLRWHEVDLDGGVLRLADSKTGSRRVPLSSTARALLASFAAGGPEDFVFPQAGAGIWYAWQRIRANAGLSSLRLHDLRHLHVTTGLEAGLSAALVGKLVGHANLSTTSRYEHVRLDPMKEAAERVGETIAAALNGRPPAEVVKLPRRGA